MCERFPTLGELFENVLHGGLVADPNRTTGPLLRMYLQLRSFATVTLLDSPVISSSAIERIYVITEKFRLKFVILHSVFV